MTQHVMFDCESIREAFSPKGELAVRMGHSLAKARTGARISQNELAKRVGVTQSSIVRFEKGLMVPRPYLQALIAATLMRPVADVFETPNLQEMFDTYGLEAA